jgi:hypothetical protein
MGHSRVSLKRKPFIMQEFIARENIKRFESQLAACKDPKQRETIAQLLEQAFQQLGEAEAAKRRQVAADSSPYGDS